MVLQDYLHWPSPTCQSDNWYMLGLGASIKSIIFSCCLIREKGISTLKSFKGIGVFSGFHYHSVHLRMGHQYRQCPLFLRSGETLFLHNWRATCRHCRVLIYNRYNVSSRDFFSTLKNGIGDHIAALGSFPVKSPLDSLIVLIRFH